MKSARIIITLLLVLTLVFGLGVTAFAEEAPAADRFSDVSTDDWYFSDVMEVYGLGLMNGLTATTFAPYTGMTRAMFATVLYRISGSPAVMGKISATFADCADGVWYSDAVLWAYNRGIVSGRGNAVFNPTGIMTRQEMAVMIYNYAVYNGAAEVTEPTLDFTDAESIASWARAAVSYCNAAGVMTGDGNGSFLPGGVANRAMGAKVLKGTYYVTPRPADTAEEFDAYFEASPIIARYDEALQLNPTIIGMATASAECTAQWKAFIEKAFESLLEYTTGREREAMQREYEYYTNNHERELEAQYDENERVGGSMDILTIAATKESFYREKGRIAAEWLYRYDANFWVSLAD